MDISVTTTWVETLRQDVDTGDLFAAKMSSIDVIAIMSKDEDGNRFGLVLAYRGSDSDLAKNPPPAGRSLSTLGLRVRKYKGKVDANALPESGTDDGAAFPIHRTEAEHGDLAVDTQDQAWVYVVDHMVEHRPPMRFFVNLHTGQVGVPSGATLHRRWELSVKEQSRDRIICRFGAPD